MSGVEPEGALVVITGAGSGIGEATALRYAKQGARVIATDIDLEAAEATAEACTEAGADAAAYACDVAVADQVQRLADTVGGDYGDADVLVNNAGVGVGGPFLETSLEDWEWLRSINLDGVVHGCHVFGSRMAARGRGQIVNVASSAGRFPNRRMATYCASKAAVIMLTRCLRADWSGTGVGVGVVCPGVIKTPILGNTRIRGLSEGDRGRAAAAFKIGHSPDAVAKAIVSTAKDDRAVANVGIETHLIDNVVRFAPERITGLLARI